MAVKKGLEKLKTFDPETTARASAAARKALGLPMETREAKSESPEESLRIKTVESWADPNAPIGGTGASYARRLMVSGELTQQENRALQETQNRQAGNRAKRQEELEKSRSRRAAEEERSRNVAQMETMYGIADQEYNDYIQSEEYQNYQRGKAAENRPTYLTGGSSATGGTSYGAMQQSSDNRMTEEEEKAGQLRATADYFKGQIDLAKNQAVTDKNIQELESWPEEDQRALAIYAAQKEKKWYENIRPGASDALPGLDEALVAGQPLFDKYGKQRVDEIAESWRWQQNEALSQELEAAAREESGKNFASAAAHSAMTVGTNLVGNLTSPLGYLEEMSNSRTGQYTTMDPNNAGNMLGVYSGAVREEVAQSIAGENGNPVRQGLSYGYQAMMSAADSVARAIVGGGNEAISLGLAGLGSFGDTMSKASAQGATPAQAAMLATVNAGLEIVTEKIPLEKLLNAAGGGAKGLKQILISELKQAGIEASTEEISLIGSVLAEAAILGEKSEHRKRIAQLVNEGYSYEQASNIRANEELREVLDTAIVSGLSGGMSQASAHIKANIAEKYGANRASTQAGTTQTESNTQEENTPYTQAQAAQESGEKTDAAAVDNTANQNYDGTRQEQPNGGNYDGAAADQLHGASGEGVRDVRYSGATNTGIQRNGRYGQGDFRVSGELLLSEASKKSLSERGKPTVEMVSNNDPQAFSDALNEGRNSDAKNGWSVSPKTVSELNKPGVKMYLARNGEAGFAINNGDIEAVFTNKAKGAPKGASDSLMLQALSAGGDRLDCYGYRLAEMYSKFGFEPVARVEFNRKYANPGWTPEKGTPYVYVMMHNGDSADTVASKLGTYPAYTKEQLDALPTYGKDDYKAAIAYRNELMNQRSGAVSAGQQTGSQRSAGKSEGNTVGAAERNYSGLAEYENLLSDDNVQPERASDTRHEEVPKYDAYGRKVSEFAANAMNTDVVSDRDVDTAKKLIAEGAFGHETQKMADVRDKVYEEIKRDGLSGSKEKVTKAAASGKISEHDIAKAEVLFAMLSNKNGTRAQEMAGELLVDLEQMATQSARQLNMFKLLRMLTPEGQLAAVKKNVTKNIDNLVKSGQAPKGYESEIDPDLVNAYTEAAQECMEADTPEKQKDAEKKRTDAERAIYLSEASKIPATFKAKWDAWRYMCMMGNVKTNVRNVIGNLAFIPYTEAKRAIGAAVEKLIPKDQRTKAVLNPLSETDRELMQWAKADAKSDDVKNALEYSAKLGDDVSASVLRENRQIFKNGILEKARKLSEALPAKGDMLFKNSEYAKSLASFLKARGYSYADIQSGNVSDSVMTEGREYAIREAMKATFNDCNAFSDFIANELRYRGENPFGRAMNILGEGIMPFRRTPANIVVRMVENSPLNLVRSVVNMATKVRSGKMSAATAIDQFSAGLTGTGAMVLGFLLAKGIGGVRIRGSEGDEDEKRQGHQAYSIEFSLNGQEYSYTIDWAAPANLPLFVGANIYRALEEAGGDTELSKITAAVYSLRNMLEPMLALSCMSSINDLFEAGRYAGDGEAIYSVAAQAATSYLTQGIPSLLRQTYQATQENKKSTFANSEDPLVRDLERQAANIPFAGAAFQTDARNAWGETESRGNPLERMMNAFLNPGTAKAINNSALEQEISRLNKSQPESVSPPDVAKTITYTDANGQRHTNQRLTAQQYSNLSTIQGQTASRILSEMVESSVYKAMTDEQKAKAFGYVYDYARETAREQTIDGYSGISGWMEGIDGKETGVILERVVSGSFSDAMDAITSGWRGGYEAQGAEQAMEDAYSVYEGMTATQRRQYMETVSGRLGYYMDARNAGISTDTFLDLYRTFYEIDRKAYSAQVKAEKWAFALEKAREAGTISKKQENVLKDSMVYYQMFPAQTEKFDQMTESGLTADEAIKIGSILDSLQPQSGYSGIRDIQRAEAIGKSDLSEEDKIAVMKIYLPDSQDKNLDDMLAMGYGTGDYLTAWRIYDGESGEGKKRRTIQKYMTQFGVDEATAAAIYKIYGG